MTEEEEMKTWQDVKRRLKKHTYLDAYQLGVGDGRASERTRSAKLIEALNEIAFANLDDELCGGLISDGCIARAAIAEYEASK